MLRCRNPEARVWRGAGLLVIHGGAKDSEAGAQLPLPSSHGTPLMTRAGYVRQLCDRAHIWGMAAATALEKRNESQYTNVYYVTVRTFDYGTTYYAGIYTSMSLNVGTCWRTN